VNYTLVASIGINSKEAYYVLRHFRKYLFCEALLLKI